MLLALCLLTPLAAEATNVDDSLIVGIQSTKTPLLRPLDPKERDIMSIYDLVYDGLVTIDDDYLPQPALAESWTESGGGKTWTFRLREGGDHDEEANFDYTWNALCWFWNTGE